VPLPCQQRCCARTPSNSSLYWLPCTCDAYNYLEDIGFHRYLPQALRGSISGCVRPIYHQNALGVTEQIGANRAHSAALVQSSPLKAPNHICRIWSAFKSCGSHKSTQNPPQSSPLIAFRLERCSNASAGLLFRSESILPCGGVWMLKKVLHSRHFRMVSLENSV